MSQIVLGFHIDIHTHAIFDGGNATYFFWGVFGIILGALFSYFASVLVINLLTLDWSFVFPVKISLMALVFSVVVGLIFGIYPARKASKKSPMEALRYEYNRYSHPITFCEY